MKLFKRTVICVLSLCMSLSAVLGMTPQRSTKIAVETVVLSPGNTAPIAENIEISTYRNTIITGQLQAYDAENEQIYFELTNKPKQGKVTIYEDGSFSFDPCGTKKNKVIFSYIAIDASGNKSNAAEVVVYINKQTCSIIYSDVDAKDEYFAVFLAENDIYTGQCIGSEYFFNPDRSVTKGEFLSMCLTATGHDFITDITRTGLSNDEELPPWVKNCVSTAALCGCFRCDEVFKYDEVVTYEEAAVIINDVFEVTDVISASSITPYLRQNSAQAINNLYFCGISDADIVGRFDKNITMIDAAKMITKAVNIFNNR